MKITEDNRPGSPLVESNESSREATAPMLTSQNAAGDGWALKWV